MTGHDAEPTPAEAGAASAFARLVALVTTLRGPEGCPWDRAQTRESLTPYLIEETYELVDAIRGGDPVELKEELGDVLFQVLFHADMSREQGAFDIASVIDAIHDKMVHRHPHVFADGTASTADEVSQNWDVIKANEPGKQRRESVLDGVPRSLPALLRAQKISKKAAGTGFEWSHVDQVWDQVHEEIDELKAALAANDLAHAQDELGDVLFSMVNLARKLDLSADEALTGTIERFYSRFTHMEQSADGALSELSETQWADLWQQAKAAERRQRG